jgi:glycosyltransferase involved in cell wall biosynthesis
MNTLRQWWEQSEADSSHLALQNQRIILVGSFAAGLTPQQGILLKHYLEQEGYRVRVTAKTARRWFRPIEVLLDSAFFGWQQDVFLVQVFGGPSFIYETAAIIIARLYCKRIVCILRGGNLPNFADKWPRWVRFVLGAAHQLVVPSSFLQNMATKIGPPALIIPNIIEIEKYPFSPHERLGPKFLWMRTFHSFWNPFMALQAFEQVKTFYPNATLTMAGGEGPELVRCCEYVEKRQLSGVCITGFIDKAKIPDFAARHDIYLNTNDVDNMPVTLIEMWALGLPVVTTDAEGICHLVRNDQDALVVPRRQPEAMAAACVRLLKDSNLASRLIRNGRRRSEACTWSRTRASWLLAIEGKEPCVES